MHGRTDHVHSAEAATARSAHPALALASVLGALLLVSVDHTIINVALPEMVRELGTTSTQLQWLADAYPLAFAGVLLVGGAFGDRRGRRLALLIGLGVFTAGSLVAAVTTEPAMVIAGRTIMGLGGAFVMPATLSSLVAMFDGARRTRAVAAWTATSSLGVAIGPLVGGLLLSWWSWQSVFWVNVPIGLLAAAGIAHAVPEHRADDRRSGDAVGAALSMLAIATLVWSIIQAPHDGWTDTRSLLRFAVAVASTAAFVVWERRATSPMLDLRAVRSARIGATGASIAIAFLALGGSMFLVAQYLQLNLGLSPLRAGAALLPAAVGLGLGSHLASHHQRRDHASGHAIAIGTLVAGWGLVVQAIHTDGTSYLPTGIGLLLIGLGLGSAVPAATETILERMPREQSGVASAINDTVREVGAAIGIAILGSVATAMYRNRIGSEVDLATLGPVEGDAVSDGIGSALAAAEALGPAGRDLARGAQGAFLGAVHAGLWVAAASTAAGALLALVGNHRRRGTAAQLVVDVPVG